MGVTLEEVAAELYGGPLDTFVQRRAARAKELKAEDADLAGRVAKLPKPVVSAHALNLFAREHPDLVDDLLDVGGELREAQEQRDGERVRALTKRATDRVRAALATLPSDPAVEQTLRAAMADEGAAAAVRAGVLVKPLAPAGFGPVDLTDAVAVTTSSAPRPRRRKPADELAPRRTDKEEQRAKEAEQAAAALAKAEARLAELEEALAAAAEEHGAAKERVTQAEAALDEARQQEREAGRRERDARQERDLAARPIKALTEKAHARRPCSACRHPDRHGAPETAEPRRRSGGREVDQGRESGRTDVRGG
jgi:hypothetical protein